MTQPEEMKVEEEQQDDTVEFTDEEMQAAHSAEQVALVQAMNGVLIQRNTGLRANLDRALKENEMLREKLESMMPKKAPQDRKAPAKKTAAKRTSARKKS